jgi:DDE_Tnp_1-associated
MTSSPVPAARSQYLLDLLAQVPDPRKRRGRRHPLAGLPAAGIAAVIAGSRSFAAIGQWAADAGPEVLAVVEGHLVAVGVRERESAAERPVDGR